MSGKGQLKPLKSSDLKLKGLLPGLSAKMRRVSLQFGILQPQNCQNVDRHLLSPLVRNNKSAPARGHKIPLSRKVETMKAFRCFSGPPIANFWSL